MKKEPTSIFDIFDKTSKLGRPLVSVSTLATVMTVVVVVAGGLLLASYALNFMNLAFIIKNVFLPSVLTPTDVTLVPSSSPSCVGDFTLTIGSNSIDCLGTSPTKVLCEDGYEGVLFAF